MGKEVVPGKPLRPNPMFVGKARSLPIGVEWCSSWVGSGLTPKQ
jgi:hypothetical protein